MNVPKVSTTLVTTSNISNNLRFPYIEYLNEGGGPLLQKLCVVVDAVEVIGSQVVGCFRYLVEDGPRLAQVVLHLDQAGVHP